MKLCYTVCRPSEKMTCSFHGTFNCTNEICHCKAGYSGDQCQFCEKSNTRFCMAIDNSITEGEVDQVSGNGVKCSCKACMLHND